MPFISLAQGRRVGAAVIVLGSLTAVSWHFLPGLPVWWGPSASAADKAAGQDLFEHEWQPNDPLASGDGLGPVFNAHSCVACHFQGGVGGGGSARQNIASYEVLPSRGNPHVQLGVVHASSVDPADKESWNRVRQLHPVVKGSTRTTGDPHCPYTVTIPDFDPLRAASLNSTALFGAGWVDRVSGRSIQANRLTRAVADTVREFSLDFSAIPPGRARILSGGRVGKFGWKAQFATLREFVASACANELGLSNPLADQPAPLGRPDYAAAGTDLTGRQVAQLVAFVDTLPRPVETDPADEAGRERAARGRQVFAGVGCAVCHTPDLGGVRGVYSDFLLHSVDRGVPGQGGYGDPQNPPVPLPDDYPQPDEWKTPALWGVADSAPYFHDGASPTLQAAIQRHAGDAAVVTAAYNKLPAPDKAALLAFLGTLKAPPDAAPAVEPRLTARR